MPIHQKCTFNSNRYQIRQPKTFENKYMNRCSRKKQLVSLVKEVNLKCDKNTKWGQTFLKSYQKCKTRQPIKNLDS